jgi:hypothetical protein
MASGVGERWAGPSGDWARHCASIGAVDKAQATPTALNSAADIPTSLDSFLISSRSSLFCPFLTGTDDLVLQANDGLGYSRPIASIVVV